MKKLLIFLWVMTSFVSLIAQQKPLRFGIKGGINYISLENYGKGFYSDFDAKPGWSAGILAEYTKHGFFNYSFAPELLMTESVTEVDFVYITDFKAVLRTIDLPLNFRAGLQLSKIFRPYLMGNVYGSYIVNDTGEFFDLLDVDGSVTDNQIRKFYFGLSAGMGFDLWKFEIEGRYRWNLTKINTDDYESLRQMGLELSCAILF